MSTAMVRIACCRYAIVAALALGSPWFAWAQQAPITGQMLAPPTERTQVTSSTSIADPQSMQSAPPRGTVTRSLLDLQVSGSRAGKALPILGDEASASYVRYMKSFEHPIPEFFQGTVAKSAGPASGSQQGP